MTTSLQRLMFSLDVLLAKMVSKPAGEAADKIDATDTINILEFSKLKTNH